MLAPQKFSQVIPLIRSDYPQLCVRGNRLQVYALGVDELKNAESRFSAWALVSGDRTGRISELKKQLKRHNLRSIIIDRAVLSNLHQLTINALFSSLKNNSYTLALNRSGYLLFIKSS